MPQKYIDLQNENSESYYLRFSILILKAFILPPESYTLDISQLLVLLYFCFSVGMSYDEDDRTGSQCDLLRHDDDN